MIETANPKVNYTRPPSFLNDASQPTSAIKVNKKRILESIVHNLLLIGEASRTRFEYCDKYGLDYGFKPLLNNSYDIEEEVNKEDRAHECIKNFDEINSNQEDRNTLLNNINNILSKDEKTKIRQKI